MYCTTPEEKAMLDLVISQYPDSDVNQLELNVYMWFNQREEYVKIMDECKEKYGDTQDAISFDDERLRSLYPKNITHNPPTFLHPDIDASLNTNGVSRSSNVDDVVTAEEARTSGSSYSVGEEEHEPTIDE
jgi:hypothetical protein